MSYGMACTPDDPGQSRLPGLSTSGAPRRDETADGFEFGSGSPTNPDSPRLWARSYIERDEEPERVVGKSDLLEADGGPKFQHLVEGNAEDELDVVLGGLIEQRRQDQPNAPRSVAKRRGGCETETWLIRRATPARILQTAQIRLDRRLLEVAPAIACHPKERHARGHQRRQLRPDWSRAEERPVHGEQSFRPQEQIPTECIVVAEHLGQSIKRVEELLTMRPHP